MSYQIIDKLARIPMRGKEPKSVNERQELYQAISPFIEGKKLGALCGPGKTIQTFVSNKD